MPSQVQRVFATDFKERVVLRIDAGERLAGIAEELGIRRKLLYQWRDAYRTLGVAGLNRRRGPKPGGRRSLATGDPPAMALASAPSDAPAGAGAPADALARAMARIEELERKIGRQELDIDFFRKALRLFAGAPGRASAHPATSSTRSSRT
jgi:transposase-like protein